LVLATSLAVAKTVLARLEPLHSGRDTEIDMIEREMEGGVVIIQPLDWHDHYTDQKAGGLFGVEGDITVQQLGSMPRVEPRD
jgi:hypothetical protein